MFSSLDWQELGEGIWQSALALTWLEIGSVIFLVAYVILATRENVWCWPAGIIGTALYFFFCLEVKLYAEMTLQLFYLVMSIYGWHVWISKKQNQGKRPIVTMQLPQHFFLVLGGCAVSLCVGFALSFTNATLPYIDTFTSVFGIITTWLAARKFLENWLYWIVIDIVYTVVFWHREWYLFSLLYAIYTILAVVGYFAWKRSLTAQARQ